jgi:hypothetical protein
LDNKQYSPLLGIHDKFNYRVVNAFLCYDDAASFCQDASEIVTSDDLLPMITRAPHRRFIEALLNREGSINKLARQFLIPE